MRSDGVCVLMVYVHHKTEYCAVYLGARFSMQSAVKLLLVFPRASKILKKRKIIYKYTTSTLSLTQGKSKIGEQLLQTLALPKGLAL